MAEWLAVLLYSKKVMGFIPSYAQSANLTMSKSGIEGCVKNKVHNNLFY